ncbi:hypothetical protein [Sulfitobacter guttiformis]|uniref:hypothetical protein n=1 Tax=Sulfitobacter guttiformis TaxID=74349 RepID=UPI00046A32A0|nr:hypothetical protein [Sulfitobacter guttiformis]KIN74905.1 hypothetical protein Z949_4111 [Sulfitobacter guttiformis KCTC 32187]
MYERLLPALLLIILAGSSKAGPWLREKGSSFTASSISATYFLDTSSQTYLEYGLTDKTTLIADISMLRLRFAPESGYAIFSLRRALSTPDATSKWAYEAGIGAGWIGVQTLPIARAGLSWGRGIKLGEKSGWATIEASLVWDVTFGEHIAKLDTTVGLNFTDLTAGMLQLYTVDIAGETAATLAPSVVLSPDWTKFRFQFGAESELGNIEKSAIKLGLWREF